MRAAPNRTFNFVINSLLATIVAAILLGCGHSEPESTQVRPALIYKIGEGGGIDAEVYPGEVRARIEADMAFRIGGKMISRLVDQGSTVKRGQVLAQLDPQDVKLAADGARAQVSASKAEYDFAEAEAERFKTLLSKNFISQSAYDAKINARDAAKARYESASAQAAVNLNQAAYATLVAEQDGVVTQVLVEAGQVVAQGQPIVRIADPSEKEVAISVSESRIGEFRAAKDSRQMYIIVASAPDKHYPSQVRQIGAAADPATRTYPVRVKFLKTDVDVKLGMTAYTAFVGASAAGQISVPLSAIYQQGDKALVWLVGADNKLSARPVTIVKYHENAALITGALKPGDTIVAAGVHKLREGQAVKPVSDPLITGNKKIAIVPIDPAVPQLAAR